MAERPTGAGPFETAHEAWDTRWTQARGRADWLELEPDVRVVAGRLAAAGARRALDLGCGVGRHALFLAGLGLEVFAVDASDGGLAYCRETARAAGLPIALGKGLMSELPFSSGAFDYVLAWNVVYHGDETVVTRTLAEIARVLAAGGAFQGTLLSTAHESYGRGREVAPGTFVMEGAGDDKAHPHYYCDEAGARALLRQAFEMRSLIAKDHAAPNTAHWHFVAERRASGG
jgi:SAM-dependent methyltransferase